MRGLHSGTARRALLWLVVVLPGVTRGQIVEIVHAFEQPPRRSVGELCAWNGDLYGTTSQGGDFDEGTIFKVSPAGAIEVLHSFGGPGPGNPGRLPQGGVTCVPGGPGGPAFYGTTSSGGASNQGTVYRLVPGGSPEVLHSFSGLADGGRPSITLTEASDGFLYGATSQGARLQGCSSGRRHAWHAPASARQSAASKASPAAALRGVRVSDTTPVSQTA